jgi:hypothetical protein
VNEKRCRAEIRAAGFGYYFLGLQFAVTVPWLTLDFLQKQMPVHRFAESIAFLIVFSIVFLLQFSRSRRKARVQIARIEELRRRSRRRPPDLRMIDMSPRG